jgi:3-oxoacyl-(acyl-carrier-protein) synthase
VVSGVGIVTPLGLDVAEVSARLGRGEEAVTAAVPEAPHLRLASAPTFDPRAFFTLPKALKLADRKTQLAVAAAALAVNDAGLAAAGGRDEWTIVLGCSASSPRIVDLARALNGESPERAVDDLALFAERVFGGLNPLWLLLTLPNMVGAHVGIQLAAHGPNHTVTSDWIAGTQAIGEAWLAIAGGECDVALAGGADAVDAFDLGCLAQDPRRLVDDDPFVVAEGAAVLVLEERERALRRGARLRGEVQGYAAGPPGKGETAAAIGRTAARALAARRCEPEEISLLAPATCPGHPWRREEDAALGDLQGSRPAVLAAKAQMGHALAASGPIDAALLLAALAERSAPAVGLALSVGTVGQSAALVLGASDGA